MTDSRPNHSGTHPRFFLVTTSAMVAVVFLGFAPTFYLGALFETPDDAAPMPTYLVVHGVIMTTWFLGLALQSSLIVRRRHALHRKLGVLGVVIAVGIVVSGAVATLDLIERTGGENIATLVTSNTLNLLVFVALVALAIRWRRKPQVHKRLMLLASIAIIGPAVGPGRMLGGFLQSQISAILPLPVPLYFWVLFVVALIVHDLKRFGRMHPATAWGGGAKLVAVLITIALVRSGAAVAYTGWLAELDWL